MSRHFFYSPFCIPAPRINRRFCFPYFKVALSFIVIFVAHFILIGIDKIIPFIYTRSYVVLPKFSKVLPLRWSRQVGDIVPSV